MRAPTPDLKLGTLPLFPKWSPEAFDAAALRNPRVYARGYEQRAIEDSELLFPSWPRLRDSFSGKRIPDLLGPTKTDWFPHWTRTGGVDLSSEKRPGNVCATVGSTTAEETSKPGRRGPPAAMRFALLELLSGTWTHPDFLDQIAGSYRRWRHSRINVEDNAQQDQVFRWAERIKELGGDVPFLEVLEHFTTTAQTKWDDYAGLPGLEIEFARGTVLVPYGEWEGHPEACTCGWCMLDEELSGFTRTGPGTTTSDHVMALLFAVEGARAGATGAAWLDLQLRR